MFVVDIPDVQLQYAPIVIAQLAQGQPQTLTDGENFDHTIGVCHLIQNPPIPPGTAVNALNPLRAAKAYLNRFEQQYPELKGTVTLLQGPDHAELEGDERGVFGYFPTSPDYRGPDRATFKVEIGGLKVKVMYFFKVDSSAWGGTEGYDPYQDKNNCPQGPVWKISLSPGDPNVALYTFEQPSKLTNAIKANLTITDSPFGALGQTTGTSITLNDNVAGHSWFIDSTPWSNEEPGREARSAHAGFRG